MNEPYSVQARLVRWRGTKIVRDDSRTASAESLSAAMAKSDEFVADGYTTWIYRLERGSRISPVYRLVRRSSPPAVSVSTAKPHPIAS